MNNPATKPTHRTGVPYPTVPGLPPIWEYQGWGTKTPDYGFSADNGFVDSPNVIRLMDGEFFIVGTFDRLFNSEIFKTGARRSTVYRLWFHAPLENWAKVVAFAAKWNARFNQPAFDVVVERARVQMEVAAA